VADDEGALRRVLVQRFTSLAHLMRAALVLQGLPGPVRRADVVESAVAHLGVDRELVDAVAAMRQRRSSPDRAALVKLFGRLLEAIRVVDAAIGEPSR